MIDYLWSQPFIWIHFKGHRSSCLSCTGKQDSNNKWWTHSAAPLSLAQHWSGNVWEVGVWVREWMVSLLLCKTQLSRQETPNSVGEWGDNVWECGWWSSWWWWGGGGRG
jgi:hypothetical protein